MIRKTIIERFANFCFYTVAVISSISCEDKQIPSDSYLSAIDERHYYDTEVVPTVYQKFYGYWRLDRIVGGITGQGRPADFDYLEVKRYGIYAAIKENKIVESGSFKVDTFDLSQPNILQISFNPDHFTKQYVTFPATTGYIQFKDEGMYIGQPCCDTFLRLFVKDDRKVD